MTIESHRYRSDIDGLRALAVVPVVLYHAGIPGFSGGFVGVDVFFVISGYLITSIIEREIREKRFSLAGFYERRVRRIIPALFVMMIACAIAAPFLLYPQEYESFSRSLVATTLFVSSALFRREGGYFDVDSLHKPLLHTWSLSVEEIFYVFFPVLLLVVWHYCKANRGSIVWAAAILSFFACVGALYLDNGSRSAFFLPHFRAWEFLIGAILALSNVRAPHRRWLTHGLSVIGVMMIAAAVFAYSDSTTFPGAAALLPCLGAAAVIVAGQHKPSLAGHLMSSKPFVFTGLISYSLYLWHWPILVFAGLWLGRRPSGLEASYLIAVSFVLAAISWRYVERPFRGKSGWLSRQRLFAASAAVGALIISIGLHGEVTNGWLNRYPDALRVILKSNEDRDPRQTECLLSLTKQKDTHGCIYGRQDRSPAFALWGDSHAAIYSVMLGKLAEANNGSVWAFTMPACPPAMGWQIEQQKWRGLCAGFQRYAMQQILETSSIHTVFVAGNLSVYANMTQPGFAASFTNTVEKLVAAGKRVVLIYPFPMFDSGAIKALARAAADGKDLTDMEQPLQAFLKNSQRAFHLLDSLGSGPSLLHVYPHLGLCDERNCFIYRDGQAFYFDNEHLSLSGASRLSPLFAPFFEIKPDSAHDSALQGR